MLTTATLLRLVPRRYRVPIADPNVRRGGSRSAQLLAGVLLLGFAQWAHPEDIDLFAGLNASDAANPTLVIVLDNSASSRMALQGNTKIAAAREALAAAFAALTDATGQINVGLVTFNGTSGSGGIEPSGSLDGAHVRYAARPMNNAANRASLAASLRGVEAAASPGPGAQFTAGLEEARRYLGGRPPLYGTSAGAGTDPDALDPGGRYASPLVAGGCQKTLLLVIGNGPPDMRDIDLGAPLVRALAGGTLPAAMTLPAPYPAPALPPSQDVAGNWMDEFAGLVRRSPYADSPSLADSEAPESIVTYGIAIHDPSNPPENTPPAASGRALILNAAMQGGGKYFDATESTSLASAIGAVLAEAQAVNAVFASPSLPVSVNSSATYANQVYMGMFRADGIGGPRWLGNLKQYQLAYDASSGLLELVDAQKHSAIDALNGFLAPTAQSFWSTAQTTGPVLPSGFATVDFFANAPAGTGLTPQQAARDVPDGEVVEKGGAAERLRASYLGTQAARRVFTCPLSGCIAGTSLGTQSAYAFNAATITCASHQSAFGLDSATCAAELPRLIDWIRGADNTSPNNEASSGPGGLGASPIRPSVHGDVIHSRPLLIDYGAAGVVAFYGANDGMLRAVQAGQSPAPGNELWAFIAPEHFSHFKRQRDATPPVQWPSPSSGLAATPLSRAGARPKDYFFDSPPAHFVVRDAAGNVSGIYLFVAARRGGSFVYAFDVTTPGAPKFLWRHAARDSSDPAFDDLALTFSAPKGARVGGYARPVAIFGGGYAGGYDGAGVPVGEDADPAAGCASGSQAGCGNRIFVVDAANGAVVKTFQQNAGRGGDLAQSVAADITLVDSRNAGTIDRAYAADTGGALWRIDFDARGPAEWKMYKLAQAGNALAPRKFLHAPDAVVTKQWTAVLAGSGDREKPLKAGGSDRFYMIKDKVAASTVEADGTGAAAHWPIDADLAALDNMADVAGSDPANTARTLSSPVNNGWFLSLGPAERVVNAPLTAAGVVYFGTNQPSAANNSCRARLGVARAYGLNFNSGQPGRDLNADGVLDRRDVAVELAGGGLPPSPVGGLVTMSDPVSGKSTTVPFIFGAGGAAGGATGLPSQSAPARIAQKLKKSIRKTWWYQRPPP